MDQRRPSSRAGGPHGGIGLRPERGEIALRQGFLTTPQFEVLLGKMPKSSYRSYLEVVLAEVKG